VRSLEKRLTHTYVGTYSHLDKWSWIADYDELCHRQLPPTETEEFDCCEPLRYEIYALLTNVDSDVTDKDIEDALRDTYTSHGCHHDYDCCGCRSWWADEVTKVDTKLWRVIVGSSRNY
jgi:hypothetical protein